MSVTVFDQRRCRLGEGPLWHPIRQQLFWFDILSQTLLSRDQDQTLQWGFDEQVSAAGWIDQNHLLIASETELFRFNLETAQRESITGLEADNPLTRSNDGRADPWGGFWIGTMGKNAEPELGSIYRHYRGELRRLFPNITISNSICFAPDKPLAYFCDTSKQQILCQPLSNDHGWPIGEPRVFIDLRDQNLSPDGSVVDARGELWNAQWGASRIAHYSAAGEYLDAIHFPATQISCPAFGGKGLSTLFATSAQQGLAPPPPEAGQLFSIELPNPIKGQAEHPIIL